MGRDYTKQRKLQRVITLSRGLFCLLLFFSFFFLLSFPIPLLYCSALVKMTRFAFLSLAFLSLQAFVGTGLAAVGPLVSSRDQFITGSAKFN